MTGVSTMVQFEFCETTFTAQCRWFACDLGRQVRLSLRDMQALYPELAYCYVRQRWPGFSFGSAGSLAPQLRALGAARSWQLTPPPAKPDWVAP